MTLAPAGVKPHVDGQLLLAAPLLSPCCMRAVARPDKDGSATCCCDGGPARLLLTDVIRMPLFAFDFVLLAVLSRRPMIWESSRSPLAALLLTADCSGCGHCGDCSCCSC